MPLLPRARLGCKGDAGSSVSAHFRNIASCDTHTDCWNRSSGVESTTASHNSQNFICTYKGPGQAQQSSSHSLVAVNMLELVITCL